MREYYVITMETQEGMPLYLGEFEGKFKWTKYLDGGIWFDTERDAKEFAKSWFKNFKDWEIREI